MLRELLLNRHQSTSKRTALHIVRGCLLLMVTVFISCSGNDGHNPVRVVDHVQLPVKPGPPFVADRPSADSTFLIWLRLDSVQVSFRSETLIVSTVQDMNFVLNQFDKEELRDRIGIRADSSVPVGQLNELVRLISEKGLGRFHLITDPQK